MMYSGKGMRKRRMRMTCRPEFVDDLRLSVMRVNPLMCRLPVGLASKSALLVLPSRGQNGV
jgi:hypothetical protein